MLDNPGRLTELVEKSGAKSTDYQNLESAKEWCYTWLVANQDLNKAIRK